MGKKQVTFSRFNLVHIIPSKEDLYNKGEISKVRKGRFLLENNKRCEIIKNTELIKNRFIVS